MIRIVIAEDHHIVRQGIKLLLQMEADFRLAGEAADGLEALGMIEKHKPDVLLLDLMIPKVHGLEVVRQLKDKGEGPRVVILSMHADEPYVIEALRHGAAAYVLKNSTGSDLVKAVRQVMKGRRYLSPGLSARQIDASLRKDTRAPFDIADTLSNRERVVLHLMAEGHSTTEIGHKLFISPRTVETHRSNIMSKLKLRSQTELVRFAIRQKIIVA